MNIEDILASQFPEVDVWLHKEFMKTAGHDLVTRMLETFKSPSHARNWFFSEIKGFNYKRPYDLCKQGKRDEIYKVLNAIDYGVIL